MAKFDTGVTRNPYHHKGKEVLAVNFDQLKFKVDGKELNTRDVQGAWPDINTVLVFKRDKHGDVIANGGKPELEGIHGEVEIIGTPTSCNCSMSKFMVSQWWNAELNG